MNVYVEAMSALEHLICRKAYDDFYHKVPAEIGYDKWLVGWAYFLSRTRPAQPPVAYAVRSLSAKWLGLFNTEGHATKTLRDLAAPDDAEMAALYPLEWRSK